MTNNPYLAFGVTYNGIDYDIPDIKIDTGACLDKKEDFYGEYKVAACNGTTIQKRHFHCTISPLREAKGDSQGTIRLYLPLRHSAHL